jgi:hypothetical protein
METRENILKELQELAPTLAKMEKKNFYSVPENYFLDFKNALLETVKMSEAKQELKSIAPELLKLEKKQAAEIPANYFNTFSGDLMQRIRANEMNAELKGIAPTLASIDEKVNLYEVPANYFNAFPQQMLQRIALAQQTEPVDAIPGWLQRLNNVLDNIYARVFKPQYSIAFAGVASVLIVVVMLFANVEQPQPEQKCTDLLCLVDEMKISNEEIGAYLDKNQNLNNEEVFEMDLTNKAAEEQTFKDVVNSISDEDLDNAILD